MAKNSSFGFLRFGFYVGKNQMCCLCGDFLVCRTTQGKTNNWLADKLKVNSNTVSKWCRNEMQPRIENLFQIAKVLNVDVRELLVPSKK